MRAYICPRSPSRLCRLSVAILLVLLILYQLVNVYQKNQKEAEENRKHFATLIEAEKIKGKLAREPKLPPDVKVS